MAEAFRIDSPAEQAERRRKQLVAVVAHLVVTLGVAAVSHASVAKVAGSARSLVYRYFPRQEDLLYSLLHAFSEDLGRRMTLADETAGVLGSPKLGRARFHSRPNSSSTACGNPKTGSDPNSSSASRRHPDARLQSPSRARRARPGAARFGGAPSRGSPPRPGAPPDRDRHLHRFDAFGHGPGDPGRLGRRDRARGSRGTVRRGRTLGCSRRSSSGRSSRADRTIRQRLTISQPLRYRHPLADEGDAKW